MRVVQCELAPVAKPTHYTVAFRVTCAAAGGDSVLMSTQVLLDACKGKALDQVVAMAWNQVHEQARTWVKARQQANILDFSFEMPLDAPIDVGMLQAHRVEGAGPDALRTRALRPAPASIMAAAIAGAAGAASVEPLRAGFISELPPPQQGQQGQQGQQVAAPEQWRPQEEAAAAAAESDLLQPE